MIIFVITSSIFLSNMVKKSAWDWVSSLKNKKLNIDYISQHDITYYQNTRTKFERWFKLALDRSITEYWYNGKMVKSHFVQAEATEIYSWINNDIQQLIHQMPFQMPVNLVLSILIDFWQNAGLQMRYQTSGITFQW